VLVVNPGNPTGNYLKTPELEALLDLCSRRGLALISDEVFGDYAAGPDPERVETVAGRARALTFALNGISKMLALPQMKLGWIVASGPEEMLAEALGRLEVIADTYLSVNTPVQVALPALLGLREGIQSRIRSRLRANREALDRILRPPCPAHALPSEGGWSAVVRVPATRSDESWALALLQEDGVLVHPGFFFEFPTEGRLVLSLLPEEEAFREGAERLARRIAG
jgi:aspartate/methionine/tyrosine aminotransferase